MGERKVQALFSGQKDKNSEDSLYDVGDSKTATTEPNAILVDPRNHSLETILVKFLSFGSFGT